MMKKLKPQVTKQAEGWLEDAIKPGDVIRRRFFEPLKVSQSEFCSRHGIEKTKFSRILRSELKITPETATELGQAFGMSAMFFMNLQTQHDLRVLAKKGAQDV